MKHSISQNIRTNCTFCTQWIAPAGVLMLLMQSGIMVGWTSPNIARLTSPNSTIPTTLSEASWIASCLNLGRVFGAIVTPFLIEYFGCKDTILFIFFPLSTSWIFLIIANSVKWLYTSRIFGGITFGMTFACFSLYLGEVSSPKFRGTLISLALCGVPFGALISTIAETYLSMKVTSSIYLAQCVVGALLFMYLPASPYHLVKIKNFKSARKAITWYFGSNEVEKQLKSIQDFVNSTDNTNTREKFREFKSPPIKKALLVVILIFIFPQMCGLYTVMFYTETIVTKGKSYLVDPKEFVIYANIMSVVATILTIRLTDVLGRKFLLIFSSVGTTTALIGLGLHFYLLDVGTVPQSLQWLPIASILTFTITYMSGFQMVPATVLSEIFPSNIKSIAACLTALTSAFFGFVSTKSYQPMINSIGEAYVFWIHAGFAILALPITVFMLPETKGKTFQEIQDILFKRQTKTPDFQTPL